MTRGQKILAGVAGVVVAIVLLGVLVGRGDSEKVEQAVAEYYGGTGVLVVDDSCSRRGETESGYEHWVCVVQDPPGEFESGDTHEVDVAWDGSKIVRVDR